MNYQDLEKPRQYEVLILDDNEFDGKRMRRALTRLPMALNITEVKDIVGLSNDIFSKKFDIILVDFSLADGDGLQALEKTNPYYHEKKHLARHTCVR